MSIKTVSPIFYVIFALLLLSACSPETAENEPASTESHQQVLALEAAVKLKNEQLSEEPLYRLQYADTIGAKLSKPAHSNFAVNGNLVIEGTIEKLEKLTTEYAYIQIMFIEENETVPTDGFQEHYVSITDGAFELETQLFHGEGEYRVSVSLPANDRADDYYYEAMNFTVFNVNSIVQREITYTPYGLDTELEITTPESGFTSGSESFTLKGKVNPDQFSVNELLFELRKDEEYSLHYASIENGEFSIEIPLWFGKGVHELLVNVPDGEYFQLGTAIYIDSSNELGVHSIQKDPLFDEYGFTFQSPVMGGDSAELTYRIAGSLDEHGIDADEVPNLYVSAAKGEDLSWSVIPVNDFQFDDEIYLRFGPGTYTVNVFIPDLKNSDVESISYRYLAQFNVESVGTKDKRDVLPSRGVQSDAPELIALANDLMKESMSDYEKAKSVYEYTARNISYDVNKFENIGNEWDDSALKTLNLKSGICVDYSYLAIALLRAAGMEARYIVGTTGIDSNSTNHAWVEVKVDKRWLIMDPTWGAGYVENDQFVPSYTEDYFDPAPEMFETHTRGSIVY
ncbi:transglutaminase domain-containing protein [Sporosarcina aquimarina]|uniref:Transglutaminase-like domain-containing protein n=1 Tax=Sporosarcina aquimarina TaxID=114975 RepID=A0ABU4FYH9_9BACL|nr:transglutaminase-like domain-containing protein [Sporosarcina aquimarina]MDW0109783.1 transglutaminase-like domain-containing protein [Sporosarcina aquimarina]